MATAQKVLAKIVQDGDPVLRTVAKPVPEKMFGSPELHAMIEDMEAALDKEEDGVALAAPQIGLPYRMFIARLDRTLPAPPEGTAPAKIEPEVAVFINPEIFKTSRRKHLVDEGCLSCRGIYGKTRRHERVSIRAQREDGTKFTRGGGDILAQIYEHETDHLNGILFIDHAEELIKIAHGKIEQEK
jgi:peptide deformylase